MREDDFNEFQQLLTAAFDLIGKTPAAKVVSPTAQALFFQALASYPLPLVRSALAVHIQRGKFTPTPADLIEHIEAAADRDNRPGGEEAWALALSTLDDARTVVWTQEAAEAFGLAKPVMDAAGPISARKTFLEIYDRLVTTARQSRTKAHWFVSPGSDIEVYRLSLKKAVASGLLPAPAAPLQLETAAGHGKAPTLSPPEQLAAIRTLLTDGIAEKQRQADAEIDKRNQDEDEFKRTEAQRVAQYRAFIAMSDAGQVDRMERAEVSRAAP